MSSLVAWLVLERQTNIRTEMATERELDHERIRAACAQVPLIDAHAHNVVALDSNLPFLQCFSEARGHEALSSVPHSLSFQVAFSNILRVMVSPNHGTVPGFLFTPRFCKNTPSPPILCHSFILWLPNVPSATFCPIRVCPN